MGAMSLRTQLGLFYAMATSSLAAMVLAYGSYVTLASSAKQTQRAKAARDEATETGDADANSKQDAFTTARSHMALLQGLWEGLRVLLLWLVYPIMDPKLAITIASELYSYQVACNKVMQNIHRADKIRGAICKRGFLHTVATGVEKAQAAQSRPLTAMYGKIFSTCASQGAMLRRSDEQTLAMRTPYGCCSCPLHDITRRIRYALPMPTEAPSTLFLAHDSSG
ncbi:hypothetical protein VDGE_21333 [Verticillium dahliae]|uniref:Uncharacterized protein n=1 Tax=Verticillium dahliae TaxID=27337 RepID=A0A444RJL3_VERDA|nr:hypothetical protein VDGE_21333 [Verticillium dahliae]